MADTPSSVLLLRLQSTGSNTNLWGGYINTNFQILEQAIKGYQEQAITGDATISWTNYSTGNIGQCARLKLTGSPSAAAALTFPSKHNFMSVENGTLQTITVKCSGGTGVAIAAGQRVLVHCDGVDYYNAAATVLPGATTIAGALTVSGQISGVTAATAGTQAVNKTQMDAAIAIAGVPGSPGTVKVDAAAASGYLYDVLTVSGSLAKTDNGDTMNIGFTFDEGNQILLGEVLSV